MFCSICHTRQHIFQQELMVEKKTGFFYGTEVNEKIVHVKYYPKKKENLCNCACFKTRASGIKHRA